MATPRRSPRIAAQPTVTHYTADGPVKEEMLPAYRGLTEQQSNKLDKDGARLQRYLLKIQKETLPRACLMYTISFFQYMKRNPLLLLRAPTVRKSASTMLHNAVVHNQTSLEVTRAQIDTICQLYHDILKMIGEFPKNPLYLV